jgi:hypothetical protein
MQRLGQPRRAFWDWPWKLFVYHALALLGLGFVASVGVNMWMHHVGRIVDDALTQRFDFIMGIGLSVIGLSVLAAVRYWRRAPFLWACCAAGSLAVGNVTFALPYGVIGLVTMLISNKLRDASAYWFGTGISGERPAEKDNP